MKNKWPGFFIPIPGLVFAQSYANKGFEKFLKTFFVDKQFQAEHISFPIKGYYTYICNNPNGDVCKKDTVFASKKTEWNHFGYGFGTNPAVTYQAKTECPPIKDFHGKVCRLAILSQPDTDFNLNLYFRADKNTWSLIYLNYFEP